MLSGVFAQDPEDIARWEKLGVARDRITTAGSIKYDTAGQSEPLEQVGQLGDLLTKTGWGRDDPLLLAASTHAGEETGIARVFTRLRSSLPRLRLIVVPRHAERAAQIEAQLQGAGFTVARRSTLHIRHPASGILDPDILLVDATGELRAWQHHAAAVVVGKSFLGTGGQNPAEAITAGKPVFFGPHMENFAPLVRQLLASGGAVQVADFAELERRLAEVLQDPSVAARLAEAGAQVLRVHEGATARTASALLGA
jgi:3-deoxy-D-manno-octulosonic-acid transferase